MTEAATISPISAARSRAPQERWRSAPVIYDHFGIGGGQLAVALRLHWALAYLFIAQRLVHLAGLVVGGGWRSRSFANRRTSSGALGAMLRYYAGVIPMAIMLRVRGRNPPWIPSNRRASRRAAYFSITDRRRARRAVGMGYAQAGELGWLERMFVKYDVRSGGALPS